jgi:hypothetical protein
VLTPLQRDESIVQYRCRIIVAFGGIACVCELHGEPLASDPIGTDTHAYPLDVNHISEASEVFGQLCLRAVCRHTGN